MNFYKIWRRVKSTGQLRSSIESAHSYDQARTKAIKKVAGSVVGKSEYLTEAEVDELKLEKQKTF